MGRSWLLLLLLGPVVALGGCDLTDDGSTEMSEGLEALQAARAEARAARYLDVLVQGGRDRHGRPLGQRLRFAPGLMVVSEHGRIVLWERRDVSYSRNGSRSCYERHTEFEPAGTEMRRDIVVAQALIDEADLAQSGDRTVISWRGPVSERGNRVTGRLHLDRAGRPVLGRERISWLGRQPPGPWYQRRYRYPVTLDLDRPPRPRCQA